MTRTGRPPVANHIRFWVKVDRTSADGCWPWIGPLDPDGYPGWFWDNEARDYVRGHRFAWASENGPIPPGLVVDHLCFNRACCRPSHLRVTTALQNTARKLRALRCHKGHLLLEENAYIRANGTRECRECSRERQRRRVRRKAA